LRDFKGYVSVVISGPDVMFNDKMDLAGTHFDDAFAAAQIDRSEVPRKDVLNVRLILTETGTTIQSSLHQGMRVHFNPIVQFDLRRCLRGNTGEGEPDSWCPRCNREVLDPTGDGRDALWELLLQVLKA
jgi:hypothetical protein